VIGVEDGGGDIEKEYCDHYPRFVVAAVETHDEKDCPEEANHHRKRNDPVIK
jgi:hypothetical protein